MIAAIDGGDSPRTGKQVKAAGEIFLQIERGSSVRSGSIQRGAGYLAASAFRFNEDYAAKMESL